MARFPARNSLLCCEHPSSTIEWIAFCTVERRKAPRNSRSNARFASSTLLHRIPAADNLPGRRNWPYLHAFYPTEGKEGGVDKEVMSMIWFLFKIQEKIFQEDWEGDNNKSFRHTCPIGRSEATKKISSPSFSHHSNRNPSTIHPM